MNTWIMAATLVVQPLDDVSPSDGSENEVSSGLEPDPTPTTYDQASEPYRSDPDDPATTNAEVNIGETREPPPPEPPPPTTAPAASQNGTRVERSTDPATIYEGGMKWTFGSQNQNSVRIINWHQIWMRYTENNPGSLVQGEERRHQFDIGIRRSRFLLVAEFGNRFQFLTHFGINNQTFNNARKPQLFIHDATGQVRAFKEYLYVGTGLHYWHGISRMTNASTLNFLGVDAPIMNWPAIERSDQFARFFGVYIKGKIDLFDYRLALNKPFVSSATGEDGMLLEPTSPVATDNPRANSIALAGYFMFQFLEKESNALPYMVGSYLGSKKVVNLGVGFQWQKDGVWWLENGVSEVQDIGQAGVDVFVDLPMPNQAGAITFYGAYYYYNFGPDYLRMIGIMNLATGGSTLNGAGNQYPSIGTGHHGFLQAGYVLPWKGMGLHRLQPYFSAQISRFDALDEAAFIPEAGLNWHLLSHQFKITAAYRNRPVYVASAEGNVVDTRRSELIVQTHVFF